MNTKHKKHKKYKKTLHFRFIRLLPALLSIMILTSARFKNLQPALKMLNLKKDILTNNTLTIC